MITTRLREEDGIALAVAMVVMGLMLSIGLASFAFVDNEQKQASAERLRESSFNLAESSLDSQASMLQQRWPGTAATAFPIECSPAAAGGQCTGLPPLVQNITGPDFQPGKFSWTTRVRDNGGSSAAYYGATTDTQACVNAAGVPTVPAMAPCTWDANGDNQVWVRAQGVVRGMRRTVVSKVTVDRYAEQFPRSVITAGSFEIQPGAPGPLVDAKGAAIIVRCGTGGVVPRNSPPCVSYKKDSQTTVPVVSQPDAGPALSPDALNRLEAAARAENWYYPTCPNNPPGLKVFVGDGRCGSASLPDTCNPAPPPTNPTTFGTYIQRNGSIQVGGQYCGLVYVAKVDDPDGLGVKLKGTRALWGAVAVDNDGLVAIQSGSTRMIFDDRALNNLISYGGSGAVRSTFREIDG